MSKPDGIDESYSFADVHELKRRGIEVVMLYGSHTPGKNATPAKVKALHSVDIGALIGFEDTASRALLGHAAGLGDGQFMSGFMDALVTGVGYAPKNVTYHPAAYDFDTNPGQYPTLDGYQRGYNEGIAPRGGGAYGEADLLDHFGDAGLLKGGGFGTYAWSWGHISEFDDFHQFLNSQKIGNADVDFDRVINPVRLGAWWPPGHKYDSPNPTEDDGMANITPAQFAELLNDPKVVKALDDAIGPRVRNIVSDFFNGTGLQKSETNLENNIIRRVTSIVAGHGDPGHDPKGK